MGYLPLRYCDDFVILDRDEGKLNETKLAISKFLDNQLKLSLHPNKIFIRKYRHGIDFLGYVVRPYCVTLRTKTKNRILGKVNSNLAKPISLRGSVNNTVFL